MMTELVPPSDHCLRVPPLDAGEKPHSGGAPRGTREPRVLACCGGMVIVYGLERMTFEVLRVVHDSGGAVHCVVNDWENHRITELADRIGASWSPTFHRYRLVRTANPLSLLATTARVLRTSAGFLRVAAQFRPTHVFLPEYGAVAKNFPALLWLRLRGVKTTVRLGNAPPGGRFYSWFFRSVVNPAIDRYVCTSEYVRRELLRNGVPVGKTQVVYNTLHPDRCVGTSAERPQRDPNRLIYVGQIIPEKNLHVLLDAVGLLRSRGSDIRLDVIGPMDGWVPEGYAGYRERLLARAQQVDLREAISFLGWRKDVMQLMAAASVHVAPSSDEMREGCPNVVLEAKAAGLPTVAFNIGPYPELVVHGENGWLCPQATAESLAAGIAEAFSDAERLRQAGDAARKSLSEYDSDRFAERWSAVFS